MSKRFGGIWFVDMLSWMNKRGSNYLCLCLSRHEIGFTGDSDGGCVLFYLTALSVAATAWYRVVCFDFYAFLCALAKLRKTSFSFMAVRPHGTTRFLQGRFSWNFMFEYFSKICRENSSFINLLKTKRRLLYLKTQFVPRSKHFSSRL